MARVLIGEPSPHAALQMAYTHLVDKGALKCSFNQLLFTMQRKPVPPPEEILVAFAEQRAVVDELHKKENEARASLWNEAKQWTVVKWAAIVLLVLVYPLRLLVLGTRWAFRTLRT